MKHMAIAVSVAALVLIVAVSAQPTEKVEKQYVLKPRMSPDQELIKLENEWADALVKRDVAFLDRVLTEDYMATDPDASVSTKAQTLAALKSSEDVISSMVVDDMKVRVYGDTAVVTGRATSQKTVKGKDVSGQNRWTDVWVKDYAGRWQCVAGHSSRIAQK